MRVYFSNVDAKTRKQIPLTPRVLEILQSVKTAAAPDVPIEMVPVGDHQLPPNATVLAFGPYKARGGERVVSAPSGAQIVTNAAIVTKLTRVFQLLCEPPELPPFQYEVMEDLEGVLDLLGSVRDMEVDMDTEVSGVVDLDLPDPRRLIAVSLTTGGTNLVIPEHFARTERVATALERFIEGNTTNWVNRKFDLKYFKGAKHFQGFDPQLAHYCMYPASGENGLKQVTKSYFGFPDWDEATKQYRVAKTYKEAWRDEETGAWADARKYPAGSGFERIPRELLYKYAGFDTYATHHWRKRERTTIEADPQALEVYTKRIELSDMYQAVEIKGFTINVPYLQELQVEFGDDFEREKIELADIGGRAVNPNSPKQVTDWFADQGLLLKGTDKDVMAAVIEGAAPYMYEKPKGKYDLDAPEDVSTEIRIAGKRLDLKDDETPAEVAKKLGTFAETLLEARGTYKNLGTYVNGFLNRVHGSTIHTVFNLTGPITGRLANRGAGIMTIPRDDRLRSMVIPSAPGRVLVKPDYGQLEMRIVAAESNDKRFIAAFQPGMPDFFVTMLPDVFPDVDFSDWTPEAMKKSAYRTKVKPFSHGLNYGRGYRAIAAELKMHPTEAYRIANNYLGPEGEGVRAWQEEIKRKAVNNEDIVTAYGFHLQSEIITKQNRNQVENSALSFIPQGTGNDICLAAALRIHKWLPEYGAWIVATIHDQIIVDCPIETAKAVGERMEYEMVLEGKKVYGDLLCFEAEPEYGFNWSQKLDPAKWDKWLLENNYDLAA